MPEIFCDTSGWGNLFDPSQPHHRLAATIYRSARHRGQTVVTTNYVLAELVALLTTPLRFPRPTVVACIEGIRTSPYVDVVHIDPTRDAAAWQLLKSREDKEWSLVDCASFVLMQERGISDALTSDHHFQQAGFVRVLS
jgi:uncharacterized protein